MTDVDTRIPYQVWLRLRCVPEVLFGFVYIPPSDSPYFSETSISAIQEKLKTSDAANGAVIMGYLNARFGYLLQQLPMHLELNNLSYPTIPDPIRFANNNAKMIFSICAEENLMVFNNAVLETQSYRSQLTYKQGPVWTSELDYCLVSCKMVNSLCFFGVHQNLSLPSNHAPIVIEIKPHHINLYKLLERANMLGDICVGQINYSKNLYKRPIKVHSINNHIFIDKLSQCEMPAESQDPETAIQQVCNTLYQCAKVSKIVEAPTDLPYDPLLSR